MWSMNIMTIMKKPYIKWIFFTVLIIGVTILIIILNYQNAKKSYFLNYPVNYSLCNTNSFDVKIYTSNKDLSFLDKDNIVNRYNITEKEDIVVVLDQIGKKIGAIRNNETDYDRVYTKVIKDLQDGYLGKVTFDNIDALGEETLAIVNNWIVKDEKTGKLKCSFCRIEFEPQKIQGMTEDISQLHGQIIASGATDIIADTKDIMTFKCQSCGAEVVIDTSEAVQARCHWCRNSLSVNQQIPNGSIPDVVLPFVIRKEEARTEILKSYKKIKMQEIHGA